MLKRIIRDAHVLASRCPQGTWNRRANRCAAVAVVCAIAAIALGAATAAADTGVIPDTPDLPWTDPDHFSPLEVLSSQIASHVAGREVRVYCNGQNDWDILRSQRSIPETVLGYVVPGPYYIESRTFVSSAPDTNMSPSICQYLWNFAKSTSKPTKCNATKSVATPSVVTVRYRAVVAVKATRRAKINGVYVTRRLTVHRRVWRTRQEQHTTTATVPIPRVPCYAPTEMGVAVGPPAGGQAEYAKFVFAIETLAHESIHLLYDTAGRSIEPVATRALSESLADCLGMQHLAYVATALGATPDDAAAMATFYATRYYPTRQTSTPDYWSPDCVENGALDQTPGDGIWP